MKPALAVLTASLLGLCAFVAVAPAQTISSPGGCIAGIACRASTMAIGGATIGTNALAVTGTTALAGATTVTGNLFVNSGGIILGAGQSFASSGSTAMNFPDNGGFQVANSGGTANFFLTATAANTMQLGRLDAAAPSAQSLQVQSVVAGTSNTAGADYTVKLSRGTDTGIGGSYILQVAPAGSTGTTQNALVEAFRVDSTKAATFAGAITVTSGGIATNAGNINAGFSLIAGTAVFPSGTSVGRISSPGDGAALVARHDGTIPTVAQLPACTSGLDGAVAFVTDATVTTFASVVVGSGANHVPVYCDGSATAWKIG